MIPPRLLLCRCHRLLDLVGVIAGAPSRVAAAFSTVGIFQLSQCHLKNGDNKNGGVSNNNKFLHEKFNGCKEPSEMPINVVPRQNNAKNNVSQSNDYLEPSDSGSNIQGGGNGNGGNGNSGNGGDVNLLGTGGNLYGGNSSGGIDLMEPLSSPRMPTSNSWVWM